MWTCFFFLVPAVCIFTVRTSSHLHAQTFRCFFLFLLRMCPVFQCIWLQVIFCLIMSSLHMRASLQPVVFPEDRSVSLSWSQAQTSNLATLMGRPTMDHKASKVGTKMLGKNSWGRKKNVGIKIWYGGCGPLDWRLQTVCSLHAVTQEQEALVLFIPSRPVPSYPVLSHPV